MENFTDFLKRFDIKEKRDNKGKEYWIAKEKEVKHPYMCTTLNYHAIQWTLKKAWASRYARTYHDDKGKWWVGEKGSRKGFKTEQDAKKHQSKLMAKYGV